MASYLSDIKASLDGRRLCVLGDSRIKELKISVGAKTRAIGVTVEIEFVLPFESRIGTFARKMEWGPNGILCVTSNLGHVFAFMSQQMPRQMEQPAGSPVDEVHSQPSDEPVGEASGDGSGKDR
jgi:hypothetical protein